MTSEQLGAEGKLGDVQVIAHQIVSALGLLVAAGPAAASAELENLRQRGFERHRGALPDLQAITEAWRRGELSRDEWQNLLSRYGFSDRVQAMLEDVSSTLLDPASILELTRRGAIEGEDAALRLRWLGYELEDSERLLALTETLPALQDVIRWAVREVFTPEIRDRFQLDAGFPVDVLPYAAQLGFSEENARNEWASHWVLPSLQLGYEMLHRSPETGVTGDDLDLLMRAQDVMPFWRDKLKAIAYRPWTRVDVRRMHKLGVLTEDQLVRAYLDLGFDQARAEGLAEFTVRLNEGEAEEAIEPFRASLRSRIQTLYLRGALGRAELTEALVDLGHTPDQVEAFVEESELIREADAAEDVRQAVRRLYVAGFWAEDEAMRRLLELGFDQDELVRLFQSWELQRELREETEAERAERDLSKTDVLSAFRESLVTRDEADAFLGQLGYDGAERDVLLDREELRKATRARERVERTTRALYLAGRRSPSEARNRLGEIGVAPERMETLLLEWEAEREARTPELTTAQIQRAFKRGLLQREQAAKRLDDKGYSQEDREILIDLAANPDDVEETE